MLLLLCDLTFLPNTIIRNRKQIYFIHQDIIDQLDVIDKQKGMLDIIDK